MRMSLERLWGEGWQGEMRWVWAMGGELAFHGVLAGQGRDTIHIGRGRFEVSQYDTVIMLFDPLTTRLQRLPHTSPGTTQSSPQAWPQ